MLALRMILTTPTPNICKKDGPKICHTMGVRMAYKSVKIKGFLQKIWHTDPTFMAYETLSECHFPLRVAGRVAPVLPLIVLPLKTPATYEPFLLGVGVISNLLMRSPNDSGHKRHHPPGKAANPPVRLNVVSRTSRPSCLYCPAHRHEGSRDLIHCFCLLEKQRGSNRPRKIKSS